MLHASDRWARAAAALGLGPSPRSLSRAGGGKGCGAWCLTGREASPMCPSAVTEHMCHHAEVLKELIHFRSVYHCARDPLKREGPGESRALGEAGKPAGRGEQGMPGRSLRVEGIPFSSPRGRDPGDTASPGPFPGCERPVQPGAPP